MKAKYYGQAKIRQKGRQWEENGECNPTAAWATNFTTVDFFLEVVSVIKFVACSPLEKKSLFRVVASRFKEKGLHFQALRVGQINLFFFMSLFKRLAKQRVGN